MSEINVLSLFDGMSCGMLALRRLGLPVGRYFASEIDKYAIGVSQQNWIEIEHVGDVRNVSVYELPVKIDLIIGGSPCQGFSFAGKQLNFEDERSKLFFEFIRLLKEAREKNPDVKFLLENVKMKKESQDVISQFLGVEPISINSRLVSAQSRPRLYWTNIEGVTQPEDQEICLKDIMQDSVDDKYLLSDKTIATLKRHGNKIINSNENPLKSATIHANYFKMGGRDQQYVYRDGKLSKLTPVECERLQTVPDNYTDFVSDTQRYKMVGNGWTVDVIAHILKNLKR